MNIVENIQRIKNNIEDSFVEVQNKGGVMPPILKSDFLPMAIASIINNSDSEEYQPSEWAQRRGVYFYSNQHELIEHWTLEEASTKSALPSDPTPPQGLVCDGWNYTLAEIIDEISKGRECVDVGMSFRTHDGKTRLYITIEEEDTKDIYISFVQSVSNGVKVNFGDGSEDETREGATTVRFDHTYAQSGDYVITLEVVSGTLTMRHNDSFNKPVGIMEEEEENRNKLRGVDVGSKITTMRDAFSFCEKLQYVRSLPKEIYYLRNTFYNCASLEWCTAMPKSLYSDGSYYTFRMCASLTKAPILNRKITHLYYTFCNCYSLKYAPTLGTNLVNIQGAFAYCLSLKEPPVIPYKVTTLESTFYACSSLVVAPIIPNGVLIMSSTFAYCVSLRTAPEIPSTVTNVSGLFSYCYSLRHAPTTIPNGVTTMASTFSYCLSLEDAPQQIPEGVTSMNSTFIFCFLLKESPTIPSTVTTMNATFYNCFSLRHAPTIPEGVTDMYGAFYSNFSLRGSVVVPSSATSLRLTFYNVVPIEEVTFTEGASGWDNCMGGSPIKIINFPYSTPPMLAKSDAFGSASSCWHIYVPWSEDHSVLNAYKNATNWNLYAAYIHEKNFETGETYD